jgi:uncharacterized protein involved in cysteine biosynthesis
MPIDLTHKFLPLRRLESQFFTDDATLSDFVISEISAVISAYYHDLLAQTLETLSIPSRNGGFGERKPLDFPQKLNLTIKP